MNFLNSIVLAFTAASGGVIEDTQTWRFKAMLGDREIGEHHFQVGTRDGAVHVLSEADFAVRFLMFKAFGYEHTSAERYENGCLTDLNAQTQTGGKRYQVSAKAQDGVLNIQGGESDKALDGCVSTFAYWNPTQLLSQTRLLNPQTGTLVEVDIAPAPSAEPAGDVFEISGEGLNIRVYYAADDGRWVGLESLMDDGKVLRYVPVEAAVVQAQGEGVGE